MKKIATMLLSSFMMHSLNSNTCRLCAGSHLVHHLTTKRHEYLLCTDCKLLQKTNMPSPDYEKSRYFVHENHRTNKYYHKYIKEIADNFVLPELERSDNRVLDYGCGQDPYLSDFIKQYAREIVNYDYFFHPVNYEGQFDLITMIEVAEHLHDPWPIIKQLVDSLNSGGKLLIQTEPYPDTGLKAWGYKEDDTHVIFYNQQVMEFIASKLGCNLKKVSHKRWVFEK